MTSQTESSIDKFDCMTYIDQYRQPYVQAIGQAEDYSVVGVRSTNFERDTVSEMRRLRSYIESVDRILMRETNILYRLIEERTLILSDVDEIYNDYC